MEGVKPLPGEMDSCPHTLVQRPHPKVSVELRHLSSRSAHSGKASLSGLQVKADALSRRRVLLDTQ